MKVRFAIGNKHRTGRFPHWRSRARAVGLATLRIANAAPRPPTRAQMECHHKMCKGRREAGFRKRQPIRRFTAISDQDKVAAHAGHHVCGEGPRSRATPLTVASIDMAPSKSKQP